MEVFIRDVPEQVTQNGLSNLLKPYMAKLSIKTYHCQKPQQKRFAFLVFLDIKDGKRFLEAYGQDKPPRHGPIFPSKIQILSTPIFCTVSNKPPNPHILRSLEKEEKDQKARTKTIPETSKSALKADYEFSSVSCGVWGYKGADLVFVPYCILDDDGSAKFGSRGLTVKFNTGKRIEFQFLNTYGITMENAPRPSFTLTLYSAPQFFQEESLDSMDVLISRTARLNVDGRKSQLRQRIQSLTPHHGVVAGSCLVYRILLAPDAPHKVAAHMHALQKAPGLPPTIHQQTDTYDPRKSFITQINELESKLASLQMFSFGPFPWKLKFQVRLLVSNGFLTPAQTTFMLPEIIDVLRRSGPTTCIATVQRFRTQIPFAGAETDAKDLELKALVQFLEKAELDTKSNEQTLLREGIPQHSLEHMAMIHRITITPAGTYLYGPDAEPMNRVLRKYPRHHEYFIRVLFAEEDGEQVRYNPRVSNDLIFNDRFKSILRNGISIAGRKYQFLGFSHSSLRAQSCWFMAPFFHEGSLLLDRVLIQQLGDFTKIRCPAKCAARIGQAFSETPTAITFPSSAVKKAKDIKRNGRVFSEGVGTMSMSAMRKIWNAVPSMRDTKPTCFQIRYQGAKGMISLDSRLEGECILLRPSMIKFEGSTSLDIELCGSSVRPLPMYLNRQVIKIMEDMGVPDSWFLTLQAQEVERLRNITATAVNAAKFLKSQAIGESGHLSWFIEKLSTMGLKFQSDRFLRDVLELSVIMQVRVMKYRARIPVPLGMTLYGIMDETGILEEGQIFCIFKSEKKKQILIGKHLVITRSPALHPGDVQVVEAIKVPEDSPLLKLCNCICFSQKGDRDLPSKLSGGDLDGDLYNIIWDTGCRPTHYYLPAEYPRQVPEDIGREVEKDDMTDFFIKFMETDQLGRIATSHQVLADQKQLGTSDPACKMLAELHSAAVDFSKTGIPVNMKLMPKFNPVRPDFMAPGPNIKIEKKEGLLLEQSQTHTQDVSNDDEDFTPYRYYESDKILGKLYRAIDEHQIFSDLHKYRMISSGSQPLLDRVWDHVARKCRLIQWHHHLTEAQEIRETYEDCIHNIMRNYSEHPLRPISELEAFIGNILGAQGSQTRRQRDLSITMKEALNRDVSYIVGCIRGPNEDDDERSDEALARSIACFSVSLGEVPRVMMGVRKKEALVSFRYIAAAVCLRGMDRVFPP
ncbi:related to RNA-directed RNA polymerase [Phialocephala subalpina]|uniref:RNA-dependent RNA polymerase n=1 Tax=Phialocephala subalpina TaxID=576137 RepID=A0A1L7XU40_9HELO|nr:related to RNA-directed RNA polymerase [Phialocephala subalpina]